VRQDHPVDAAHRLGTAALAGVERNAGGYVQSHREVGPTLLIDEADTFLAGNEELRGILNAGHNRAYAYVLRAVGEDYEPKQFRVWAPKAIAKIGRLPPTLHSRAIQIKLQRKRIDENVVALRADRLGHLEPLRRQAARWIIDNSMSLKASEPEVPENLDGPCRR
jgi:putative DNA primase/helicase